MFTTYCRNRNYTHQFRKQFNAVIRAGNVSAKYMSKIIIIKRMWEVKGERRIKNITSD